MSRILAVAGPDAGHLYPVVGLAQELAAHGHEVVVATGAGHRDDIESAGLAFLELPLLAPQEEDGDWAHRMWDRAGQMAPALVDTLTTRPDLIVADTLTVAGAFAAELLDVPRVEVIPHLLMDSDPALPPIGLGRTPARSSRRRLDDAWIRRQQDQSVAEGLAHRDRVRSTLGLVGSGRAVARLVCSLPLLEYPRSRWPSDVHLVGRLAWEPPWEPLAPPLGELPLVLVTDSTASSSAEGLGGLAMDALAGMRVRVVVTTSRELAPPNGNVVVGRGPHEPLLAAAAVAISPGGGGFVSKAMAHGVPLVVAPEQGDQREAAARVAWAGVGVDLGGRATQASLRAGVRRVLGEPRFAHRAGLAAEESAGRGPDMAVRIVASVLAGEPLVGTGPVR